MTALVPLLLRPAFDTIRPPGRPTRPSADVSVPRLAGFPPISILTYPDHAYRRETNPNPYLLTYFSK